MAANNGGPSDHEERIRNIELVHKKLESAMLIMAELQANSVNAIKKHAEFIASQQEAMRLHAIAMAEFDGKLNAIIDIESRRQGGLESRS